MELILISLPIIFTSVVGLLHPILPLSLIVLEFIVRVYFTYFLCLSYIIMTILDIFEASGEQILTLFLVYIIYMFNYMNGFVFIPTLVNESSSTLLNQIMFTTFLCSNILSIILIYKNNYLNLKNYLNRQYFQPYLEDSDSNYGDESDEDLSNNDLSDEDLSNNDFSDNNIEEDIYKKLN